MHAHTSSETESRERLHRRISELLRLFERETELETQLRDVRRRINTLMTGRDDDDDHTTTTNQRRFRS
jgi:hypothetical protein